MILRHPLLTHSRLSLFSITSGSKISLVPTSEMINCTSQLLSKPQDEVNRKILKLPTLILDQKDKMFSMFHSNNGLVEDPWVVEREKAMINPWTSEERKIFSEKFEAFGKDFRKIASFLDHKTIADCVEFYYKDHKPNCLEKDKKKKKKNKKKKKGCKNQKSKTVKTVVKVLGKKGNHKANVDSQKKSMMVCGTVANQRTRSGRLLLWRKSNESERLAADALVGMCDSLSLEATRPPCQQPVIPNITHQDIDDGTCEWTDEEKATFLQAVSSFGEDFRMIAQHVGTKSKDQCKRFFIKGQKSHRLDLMRHRLENIRSLLNEINLGRSANTNDARVVEAIGNDKLDTETNDHQPSSAANLSHDKSKHMEAWNQLIDLNESKEINKEFDHEDKNIVSSTYNGESKLVDTDGYGVVLYNSNKSSSVKDKRAKTMPDIMEVGKDKGGDAVTELVSSASEIIEPCHSHSVAEDRLVSVMLTSFPTRLDDKDGKHGADMDDDVVELKSQSHDSNTKANTCLSSVVVSYSALTFGAENQSKLFLKRSNYSGLSIEDPLPTANSMLQNTVRAAHAVQQEKSGTRDGLSFKEPVKKQVNVDMSCVGIVTEPTLLSQKFPQIDDHHNTQLPCLSGSEKTPANHIVLKLFGKTMTIPSSTQRPDSSEDSKHFIGEKEKKKEEK
ncbi:nuclear receptor corepressor 1-like [Glycine soja]|uniref:nuclear receptor corepressor 1-like n=1 Tax=Glycine soja TaxID=3848 RepID=UPI00103D24A6|nr:nuclear receptor corepressor 1-like [Glycine soja]